MRSSNPLLLESVLGTAATGREEACLPSGTGRASTPGRVPSAHYLVCPSSLAFKGFFSPLCRRKLRLKEVKSFAQGHLPVSARPGHTRVYLVLVSTLCLTLCHVLFPGHRGVALAGNGVRLGRGDSLVSPVPQRLSPPAQDSRNVTMRPSFFWFKAWPLCSHTSGDLPPLSHLQLASPALSSRGCRLLALLDRRAGRELVLGP